VPSCHLCSVAQCTQEQPRSTWPARATCQTRAECRVGSGYAGRITQPTFCTSGERAPWKASDEMCWTLANMPRQDSLAQGRYILSRTLATATTAACDDSPEPRIQRQARATHMAYNRHPNSALLSMVSFSVADAGAQERLLRVFSRRNQFVAHRAGAANQQQQKVSAFAWPLRCITFVRSVLISS
jgi:hypothetical protein